MKIVRTGDKQEMGMELNKKEIEDLIKKLVLQSNNYGLANKTNTESLKEKEDLLMIPVGISNRHVHLCREDVDILFGIGYEITSLKELSQKGYYAAKETVTIAGPKGAINKVRLLGPLRDNTQIELLSSDRFTLGLELPVRESGVQELSPTITLIGPRGTVINNMGGMIAWRHIHMNMKDAEVLDLKDGEFVKVQTQGEREVIFANVKVRLGEAFKTELHLDSDEANAVGLRNGEKVKIIL
ncbi:phosphate propanoyltransferase [Acetobacterium wieringae]|jgi:putative phosphotransacetylase|nr:phosphate propanoyltransferase [Acetobacterium wieringae]